jgi:hypothetical protein
MITNLLLRKKYLRRISGVKQEKFEKMREQAKTVLASGAEAQGSCRSAVWDWGIAGTLAVVDVLSDIHNAFVFSANI